MKKDSSGTKQSSGRLSKEEIKKRLMESHVYNENIDIKYLNNQAIIAENCKEAMDVIKKILICN